MASRQPYKGPLSFLGIITTILICTLFGAVIGLTISGFKRDQPIQLANLKAKEVATAVTLALERLPSGRKNALPERILMQDGVYRLGDVDLTLWLSDTFDGYTLVCLDQRRKHVLFTLWSTEPIDIDAPPPSPQLQKQLIKESNTPLGLYQPNNKQI